MSDHYEVWEVLDSMDWLRLEKWVEKLLEKSKERIFWWDINDENIEVFKDFVNEFTSLYYMMKRKFKNVYRKIDWVRYFEHLRAVVNNVLDLANPTVDKVMMAISHDAIEDTDINYDWLKISAWPKVAIWVQAISKGNWEDYLTEEEKNEKLGLEFDLWSWGSWWKKRLEEIEEIWKKRRNDDYFSHLESLDNLSEHIKSIATTNWVILSKQELKELTQDVLDVKLADRIHNLSTQWNPKDLDTVERKVNETKRYFLDIAKEHNPKAYEKLKSLIFALEVDLLNARWKVEKTIFNKSLSFLSLELSTWNIPNIFLNESIEDIVNEMNIYFWEKSNSTCLRLSKRLLKKGVNSLIDYLYLWKKWIYKVDKLWKKSIDIFNSFLKSRYNIDIINLTEDDILKIIDYYTENRV